MKILFLNRVYPPTQGATGQLLFELASALAGAGWPIDVLASSNTKCRGVPSLGRRALSYLLLYPRLFWRALRLPRRDIIVTMTDPPLLVVAGAILGILKRSHHVHWAQDVYPEIAEELGVLKKGGLFADFLRWLSAWALRRADIVVAVGECMKERLIQRGLPASKIVVIPNWATSSNHASPEQISQFRQRHGMSDRFVVTYSGNFGRVHSFAAILQAAHYLQTKCSDILFCMIGDGPRLADVRQRADSLKLNNMHFLPAQPQEDLGISLGAANLHLASMQEKLCGFVVPSKVYGILAAGRPCILLGPRGSEVVRIIEQNNCGAVIPSHDGRCLATRIVEWHNDPASLKKAGDNALRASQMFTVENAVAGFGRVFDGLLKPFPKAADLESPGQVTGSLELKA